MLVTIIKRSENESAVSAYGNLPLILVKYDAGVLGANFNDRNFGDKLFALFELWIKRNLWKFKEKSLSFRKM